MTATNTVVVGTDGSSASRDALEYALQEAARRGARLRVVAVAQGSDNIQGRYGFAPLPSSDEITEEVRAVAQQQLDEVRSAYPKLAVVPVTVEARIGRSRRTRPASPRAIRTPAPRAAGGGA